MGVAGIKEIIKQMGGENAPLLQVLLAVQDKNPHHYISEEAVVEISRVMKVSRSRVYSTASFYSEISLSPRGMHIIRVCGNAPCENAGKKEVLEAITNELGISVGETTADGFITLESVSCLGACYKSPTIKIDREIYGNLTPESAVAIISGLREGLKNEQTA